METHFELYVKQNNRWILEANFQAHQREEAVEEAKQLGRQGHVQAVKVVREQRNPKTGLTREVTVYSTDRSKARRDEDEEFGSSDPYADDAIEPPRYRTPYDDDGDEDAGPNVAASTTASRAYGNFADMEVEIGGGGKDWGEMDIPSMDQIETHAKRTRRVAPARPVVAQPTAMGPATIALVKLFIILALSIAIAAAVTFMFQRMGFGSFR
jgi:hypothetical protein